MQISANICSWLSGVRCLVFLLPYVPNCMDCCAGAGTIRGEGGQGSREESSEGGILAWTCVCIGTCEHFHRVHSVLCCVVLEELVHPMGGSGQLAPFTVMLGLDKFPFVRLGVLSSNSRGSRTGRDPVL